MAGPVVLYDEGDHASRPANGAGCVLYTCTDHGKVYRDDGSTWTDWLTLPGAGLAATLLDAKGDLIAASAADTAARLAAGANGSALIAASGESTGLKWRLNNDGASAAPTVNEDSGDGYSVGSRWLDTTADKEYVCTDASSGAAVWVETTASGGSSTLTTVSATLTADRAIPNTSTYTDIVDLDAIVLAAGTWMGWVTLGIKAVANTALNIRMIDGSAVEYVEQEFVFIDIFDIESTFSFHIPPIVLGGSTTMKLQGWSAAAFTVKEFADQGSTPTSPVSHVTFLKTA